LRRSAGTSNVSDIGECDHGVIPPLRNRHLSDNGDPVRPAGTPALRFHVLGALDLRGTGGDEIRTVLVQPKRLALFAYLTLSTRPRLHRRDSLFALFWPEVDIEQARRSLRQSLHFLRQSFGAGVLISRGDEEVGVQPETIWCDAREFERALDGGHAAEALSLYRGNLLEGFHVTDVAPEFDQWLEDERARLRARAVAAATSLRDTAEHSGNLSLAVQYAREVLRLSPATDGALRWMMILLDQSGDHAAALRAYDEFSRRLASELDTQPSPETAALAKRLRLERPRAAAAGGASALAAQVPLPSGIGSPEDAWRASGALEPPPALVRRASRWGVREAAMAVVVAVVLLTAGVVLYRPTLGSGDTGAEVPAHQQLTFVGNVTLSAISPDGKSLAYITERRFAMPAPDTARLFVQDLGGGPALEIAKLDGAASLAWFPDGASVMVTGSWGVRRFPRLGGTPQVLPGGAFSALSLDGARIASWSQASRIQFRDLRSGDTSSVRIPGFSKDVRGIVWSPHGDLLAVLTSPGYGNPAIWTLAVSGRDTALVVEPTEGRVDSWMWAASGDAIYVVMNDQLWRVPVDETTGQRRGHSRLLLSNTPIYAHDLRNAVSVTTAGDRLAYTKVEGHGNVWVGEADPMPRRSDSPRMRQVTTGTGFKVGLAVSPDLQRVAYLERAGDGGSDIYTTQLSSGATERVTFNGTVDGAPAWSPTGSSLALLTTVGGQHRVAIVSASGGSAPRIFDKTAGDQIAWSPDGLIAYQVPGNRNFSLFDPTTGTEKRLVANDSVGWMFNPVFAPDGKRVVISWNRPGGRGLWLVSLVDGSQRMLPGTSYGDGVRGWTRDGRALFIEGADRSLRRVPVAGREGTVVARIPPASECHPIEPPEGLTLVCMIGEFTSDVWMVAHFDPALKAPEQ
jgi:DNA-binding SARP family transcriptional activator/Tol biopolymer transport system component